MADENQKEGKQKSGLDIKIILAGLLIFLVVMGASYFMMRQLMTPLMPQQQTNDNGTVVEGELVPLKEFTTNVNDAAGNRYLKVEVYLVVSDKKAQESIEKTCKPIIRDCILSILSSKSVADLDVRYRDNLKKEIKDEINAQLGENFIKGIYFTDFIMN